MGNCFKKPDKKNENEAPAPGTTQPAGDHEFALQLLNAQNEYRSLHGASPLTMNLEMCKEAQKWADHLARDNKLEHSKTDLGENLAMKSPTMTGKDAAEMWYSEIKDYDFDHPGFNSGTGHFTQIVWKESKEFGAGVATSSTGGIFAVGRYKPAGNITNPGFFKDNVQRAK